MSILSNQPNSKPDLDKDKISLKDQFSALNNLPRFFRLIWSSSPNLTLINIILRSIQASLPLLILYVGKLIIDEILIQIDTTDGDLTLLWQYVAIELFLAILSDILNRTITLTDSLLGDLFSNETSLRLIKHASILDLNQFEDSEFYDKLERARRQTVSRVILMSQVLTQLQDIVTVIILSIGLIVFNPLLIVLLVVSVIPLFLGESHFNERTYSLTRSWTPERRELDYLRFIGASDETAKEVKIFNLSGFLTERFKKIADKYYDANKRLSIKRAAWGSLFSTLGGLAYYGAYVYIIIQTVAKILSVGDLTFLAGSFNRLRNLLQGIMTRFTKITEGSMYLQDLFDFFEIQPNIKMEEGSHPFPKKIQHGFVFENVSFKYINSERYALKDLSLTIKPGEKVALVGENGAGKTTLVKLLARLYDPTEGRILLDGKDLRSYNLFELREQIGIIFQDYVKFQMKAFENIAVGSIDDIENDPLIQQSAKKSLAEDVINKLPFEYDQMLGKRFQDGVELSGGEWQKIALARAYMKNAQLLILDEPTSALDARAEHEVFVRFSELIEGKAAVLISHRFSTVRMADRILFLENGELRESGSHEELLAKGGKYAELFELQAKGYV